jgi:hypothetical protein
MTLDVDPNTDTTAVEIPGAARATAIEIKTSMIAYSTVVTPVSRRFFWTELIRVAPP